MTTVNDGTLSQLTESRKGLAKSPYTIHLVLTPSQIGNRMAKARDRARLTQAEAAEKLEIHEQTLSGYERGTGKKRQPIDVLQRAAMVYAVPLGFLLGDLNELAESRALLEAEVLRPAHAESVTKVRDLVTRFNISRAQGAGFGKLLAIRNQLVAAVKEALAGVGGDDPYFTQIVESMVDLLTSDSEPPVEEHEIGVKKSSTSKTG